MLSGRKKGITYKKKNANNPEKIIERFKNKYKVDINSGCWEWQGKPNFGYGTFYMNGKIYPAHRASFILFIKPIPDEIIVCHKCNNGMCVNPTHLYGGTHSNNMNDLKKAGTLAGENNPNYGVQCSSEKKKKISDACKKAWKNPEIRKKYINSFKQRGVE